MKKIIYASTISSFAIPLVTFASSKTLSDLVVTIIGYMNQALVLLMGVAIIVFVWNVVKYFIMSTEDHKAAAPYVMWSIIGFFVILSFWGLVNILEGTFGLQNSQNKPYSWTEFTNLFPGGGGSTSGTNSYTGNSTNGVDSYTGNGTNGINSYTGNSGSTNSNIVNTPQGQVSVPSNGLPSY